MPGFSPQIILQSMLWHIVVSKNIDLKSYRVQQPKIVGICQKFNPQKSKYAYLWEYQIDQYQEAA